MSLSVSAVSSVSGAMLAISGDDPLSAGSFRKKRAALLTAKLPVEPAEGSETARFQAVGTIVLKSENSCPGKRGGTAAGLRNAVLHNAKNLSSSRQRTDIGREGSRK